jgi:acylglycerol lipase
MKALLIVLLVAAHGAVLFSFLYDSTNVREGVNRRQLAALHNFEGIVSVDESLLSTSTWYTSARDGSVRFVRQWRSSKKAISEHRGLLLVSHGYGDNCDGISARVSTELAAQGFVVRCMDHVGHGRSDGLFGLVADFQSMVDDFVEFALAQHADVVGLPAFVYGDSMGGAVALLAAMDERLDDVVRAFVFAKPMVGIDAARKPPEALVAVLHRLAPLVPWLPGFAHNDMAAACFRREQDKEVARRSLLGFGAHHRFGRLGTGAALFDAVERIERAEARFSRPFLLVQGRSDTLTCPESAERFYRNAASADKHLEWIEGALHAPEFDSDDRVQLFFTPIFNFLNRHLGDK